ncbi:MAG: glycoside hydrolase family 3 C-terminal domain-containing protein [Oscillospiraceae bacterium]|nr:glycoside hydrolase family 3 C-terminal domain-containing protein [Oscillospiraceae bacterium]
MEQKQLTPQQQIRLVGGGSFFGSAGIPEQGIPRMQLLDGGTGMNFEQLFGDMISAAGRTDVSEDAKIDVIEHFYQPEMLATEEAKALYDWITEKLRERFPAMTPPGCYPPGILLGATWNPEVIEAVGDALGTEARAYGVHVLLGTPNVNLHRDVRNGRLFEGYSEDPYLISALAPSMVKGVQKHGVAANVKHFAANNQETNRLSINETISERALHELYYPGFHACVDAGVATVMSAYNQINGVPCTENRALLHDMLREEWGFDGLVMSDWGAVYHPAAAINAGNDLQMPGPVSPQPLTDALADGSLHPEALAISAQRVAKLAAQYALPAGGEISLEQTDHAAYEAAAEGIILLKNANGCCPLSSSASLAVYGEHAAELLTCGEGSAGIHTTRNVPFSKALSERFAQVTLHSMPTHADTLLYVYSLPGQEGNDLKSISIADAVEKEWASLLPAAKAKGMKTILLLNVAAPVALEQWEQKFDAIFCLFLPGMQGASAMADLLCGNRNPSGKLPLTWPKRLEDLPAYLHFPGDGMQVQYAEGIFAGYRWYDARKIEPQYPFGHGLSYTDFAVTALHAETERFCNTVTITATVRNCGSKEGKTVLQFYVRDPHSTLTKPVRELKAFRKLTLSAGETKTISITLDRTAFSSYDPNLHLWTFEEGFYEISAGFSSRDLQASCMVYADVESPYSYGPQTSVKTIMETPALQDAVKQFFAQQGISWCAMLTSYEYTAQDTISLILGNHGCSEPQQQVLYAAMRQIPKQ